MAATTNRSEAIVERRQERLEGRVLREPAMEHALDRAVPERQLRIDEPGSGGPQREHDFGMEMQPKRGRLVCRFSRARTLLVWPVSISTDPKAV